MHLRKWLKEQGVSASDLAKELGVNKSQVSRWVAGLQVPEFHRLVAIQKATGDAVRLEDWLKK